MSYAATFDTLEFARTLESKGFQTEQAEGLSMALKQAFQDNDQGLKEIQQNTDKKLKEIQDKLQEELKEAKGKLTSKEDMALVKADLKTEIINVKSALKTEVAAVRADLEKVEARMIASIATSKNEILRWFVSIALAQIFAAVGLAIAIIKMLPPAAGAG